MFCKLKVIIISLFVVIAFMNDFSDCLTHCRRGFALEDVAVPCQHAIVKASFSGNFLPPAITIGTGHAATTLAKSSFH